jgi:beta-lactamase regulating signal transducer with metallopeptidase domain
MAILNISAVLYALGWAILHSFWQMGILWVVYQLVFGLPKKSRPAIKHNSSLLLLLFGFTWFLVTGIIHFQEYLSVQQYVDILPMAEYVSSTTAAVQQAGNSFAALSDNFSRISESALLFLENNIGHISAIYLFILVLMMFRFTHAYIYSNQLKKKGLLPAGNQLVDKITDWSSTMGLHQQVHIFLSQCIDIPATIGFLKPVILLPVATVNKLSMEQVESIILHELAHIRRLDYVWNIAGAVIETILFFNPFVYLLTSVQKKERELCCDDFVLGFSRDPHNYASALLELEKTRIAGKAQLALASNGQEGQLLTRVKRILNIQSNKLQYRQRFIALLFITTLLSALAWLHPVQWKKENQFNLTTATIAPQRMLENYKPEHALSDLVKKQAFSGKQAPVNLIKRSVEKERKPANAETEQLFEDDNVYLEENFRYPIAEKTHFIFPAPPHPAGSQDLQLVWNFDTFENLRPELINEFARLRKQKPVHVNEAPPPGWNEQWAEQELALRKTAEAFVYQQDLEKELKVITQMQKFEKLSQQLSREKTKPRMANRPSVPNRVYINNKPMGDKIILSEEKTYIIRIETDDETIEINVGSDTIETKAIKSPWVKALAPKVRFR